VQRDKLATGVSVGIAFVVLTVLALVAFMVVRMRRRRRLRGGHPAAAQNATRDPSEALKLDADGGILQEIVSQSLSRTPNSTVPESANGHGYDFDLHADEEASVEVERPISPGPYSDSPTRASKRTTSRRSGDEYGGNIL
jgi:flagellar biosynthesis/type III secretory pathway M-ring protein FliF/YscJ